MNNVERAANALVRGLKETDSNSEFLIKSAKKAAQSGYVGVASDPSPLGARRARGGRHFCVW